MDHFFQIRGIGPEDQPMLEGMTALGFMAAHHPASQPWPDGRRHPLPLPGLWVKATTTLDVLSGGRAWLGIGAAWNESESRALGFPFPPLGERFEMLEETLQIAHGMWQGERGSEAAFEGRRFQATRLLNSPQSLTRPHPPIMIGGGGEQKTLRLVAQYGDATNVFGDGPRIAHKYAVLREHCERLGRRLRRDRADDEPGRRHRSDGEADRAGRPAGRGAESPARLVDRFGELADAGAQHVIFSVKGVDDTSTLELIGRDVIPQLRPL